MTIKIELFEFKDKLPDPNNKKELLIFGSCGRGGDDEFYTGVQYFNNEFYFTNMEGFLSAVPKFYVKYWAYLPEF